MSQTSIGPRLRQLRLERGLTQDDLAHQAGLKANTVLRIENGHTEPTWGTVQALARVLDVSLDTLADTEPAA